MITTTDSVPEMRVPSIEELTDVFETAAVSVAEVSLGQFLPLEQWPEGEIMLTTTVAGRKAVVYLNPTQSRIQIEIYSPDLLASLSIPEVLCITANAAPHGPRTLSIEFDDQLRRGQLDLRLHPDIRLSWTMVAGDTRSLGE